MSRFSGQHKARLIEYFCLGVPAYRLRFLMSVSQKAVQRFYKLLRSWNSSQHSADSLATACSPSNTLRPSEQMPEAHRIV